MIYEQIDSPFSTSKANLTKKLSFLSFRKNEFEITEHFYVCEETKEEFTTSKLNEININQVYNQYRDKFGLPFPDQIKSVRSNYGVSAVRMSEILGLGANTYRLYEQGEVPSVGNGRLILNAENPETFKRNLIASQQLINPKDFQKISKKVNELIDIERTANYHDQMKNVLFGKISSDQYTGYRLPDFEKISNIILFFSENMQTWMTKLNKLLFYTDYLSFKHYGYGISGLDYRAIELGPVPSNFEKMYAFIDGGSVSREYISFDNEIYGSYFKPCLTFNESLFEDHEIKIMNIVSNKFKDTKSKEIVELSHKEAAWKNNIDKKNRISYKDYAFHLCAI
ncbi:MAG: DUF4065 domain-containing protein [Flavobacteriaceae bacterium]|nr:DUF4065 domain-containing protein [Flavobacteriaceae bacterium]